MTTEQKKEAVENGTLCCEHAERVPCVCRCAYTCPVHGETHIGTHD